MGIWPILVAGGGSGATAVAAGVSARAESAALVSGLEQPAMTTDPSNHPAANSRACLMPRFLSIKLRPRALFRLSDLRRTAHGTLQRAGRIVVARVTRDDRFVGFHFVFRHDATVDLGAAVAAHN